MLRSTFRHKWDSMKHTAHKDITNSSTLNIHDNIRMVELEEERHLLLELLQSPPVHLLHAEFLHGHYGA